LKIFFDKNVVTNVTTRVPPSSQAETSWSRNNIEAIDGTHIPIIVDEKAMIKYTNIKVYTSQNVIATFDFDMRFTFAVTRWHGSIMIPVYGLTISLGSPIIHTLLLVILSLTSITHNISS
jgi:hypothetical protein